jgi:hypothetical protein
MAFGQSPGPSAGGRQMSELLELLEEAGFSGFRDARGPMGFNQRQGGGKFTGDEADMYIEQLQADAEARRADPDAAPTAVASSSKIVTRAQPRPKASAAAPRPKAKAKKAPANSKVVSRPTGGSGPKSVRPSTNGPLADASDEDLATELRKRGWTVNQF